MRSSSIFCPFATLALPLGVAPRGGKTNPHASRCLGPPGEGGSTYPGVGVVKATKPQLPSIEIDHEDIKDLMPAMQMEFYVKDRALLEGIKPGDRIEFTMENGVGGLKVTEIRRNQTY